MEETRDTDPGRDTRGTQKETDPRRNLGDTKVPALIFLKPMPLSKGRTTTPAVSGRVEPERPDELREDPIRNLDPSDHGIPGPEKQTPKPRDLRKRDRL